ncbi:MAG: NAD(P)/FAD-dependent oxidoreductase [Candidatus Wallbacteria bacterium]|nr:NAD(P)/FAD-dependent oxidoreductase [Candidatus Wallbacteria bacterium]
MSPANYDTIIIGAGMSGLAAGIRLAYYGRKVLILEKHTVPGGLNSYFVRNKRVLDVGLHAMTNYVPKNVRLAPLNKLLRQLKLKWEDLELIPQNHSEIRFPGVSLRFSNQIDLLKHEIAEKFPAQTVGFKKLLDFIEKFDALSLTNTYSSTRTALSDFFTDPLLPEMILCPLMYYGSAWEHDMDLSQFAIMFRSIFLEGFARPKKGVLTVINLLKKQFLDHGGELRLSANVVKIIVKDNKAEGVELESGEELTAASIISTAGYCETMNLAGGTLYSGKPGTMSFTEVILCLSEPLSALGHTSTIVFYNDSDKFEYRKAESLVSLNSGVLCIPDNFASPDPKPEPMLRVTNMASFDLWKKLGKTGYYAEKKAWLEKIIDKASSILPLKKENIIFTDMFTPLTVERFTGHINGAVYGSPDKIRNGETGFRNLFLAGTDQGFLGIVGAMLSGVSMANLHVLKDNG